MKSIDTVQYKKVDFRFVCSHWDIHLTGTCTHKGKLCFFKVYNKYPTKKYYAAIFSLNLAERIKWVVKQWIFEQMVGYHWSYKDGVKVWNRSYIRNPRWLYLILFKLYYLKHKIK